MPLLFVPPTINKYYILDISPGRSMVEWLLGEQQQVFTISWRNPDAAQGHFDLDTYAQAVLEARDAVAEITGQPAVNVNAACSGGIITACALGHLAAIGEQDKSATLTMMVCALDQARMGTAGAFASKELAAAAVAESARKATSTVARSRACSRGCVQTIWSGTTSSTTTCLARTRPRSTSCTGTRTASGWRPACTATSSGPRSTTHSPHPGAIEVLGTPIDLSEITLDSYAIAGLNDHIVPWENAYRSAQLLGGANRFVLSTSGHIQALVNPPARARSESRASYRVTDDPADEPETWVANADIRRGSWWPDYRDWLTQRAGELMPAPKTLGSRKHKATAKAPGNYVHAS